MNHVVKHLSVSSVSGTRKCVDSTKETRYSSNSSTGPRDRQKKSRPMKGTAFEVRSTSMIKQHEMAAQSASAGRS
jgi:hypothetical protein